MITMQLTARHIKLGEIKPLGNIGGSTRDLVITTDEGEEITITCHSDRLCGNSSLAIY